MLTAPGTTRPTTNSSGESRLLDTAKNPTSTVTAIELGSSPSSPSPSTPVENNVQDWQPGVRKQFPWLGFICLCVVVVSSVAAILVLVFSNEKSESQWPKMIAPNVCLSILASTSSIAITLAVGQGIAIAWWRRAMKGATIKELQNSWEFGISVRSILWKLKYFNTIALAALVTKLAIIDGVLFQRSTTTYIRLGPEKTIDIQYFPTDVFPSTAVFGDDGKIRELNYQYTYDIATWLESDRGKISQTYGYQSCAGTCFTKIPTIGFTFECTNTTEAVDYIWDARHNSNLTINHDLFRVNFTTHLATDERNYTWAELDVVTYENGDNPDPSLHICPGTLLKQNCVMRPALFKFPVVIQLVKGSTREPGYQSENTDVYLGTLANETEERMTLDPWAQDKLQLPEIEFIKYIDIPQRVAKNNDKTSIGGFIYSLQQYFGGSAYLTANTTNWHMTYTSLFASAQSVENHSANNTYIQDCPINQGYSVMDSIINSANALTFIVGGNPSTRDDYNSSAGYDSAYEENLVRNITAVQYKDEVTYRSIYGYMFGALASTLVCVLLILPSYWGYWRLGRQVTLGPFEIANAFQAPVLATAPTGCGHAEAVVKAVGSNKVKYTEFETEGHGKEFRFDGIGTSTGNTK